jgi:hypothetical protein
MCPAIGCAELADLRVSWAFTWHHTVPDWLEGCAIEVIPMIWGARTTRADLAGNSDWLMTFNEPDHPGQANLSPEQGATAYRLIETWYPDKLLISPAVVFGWQWLIDMRAAYISRYGAAPRFDAFGLHCYPVKPSLTLLDWTRQLLDEGERLCDLWGVKGGIWVNEWAQWDSDKRDLQRSEVLQMTILLNNRKSVAGHAMWALSYSMNPGPDAVWQPPTCDTRLLDCETGSLTALGHAYAAHKVFFPVISRGGS